MKAARPNVIERNIARCRVIFSVAAWVTVFIDPTRPILTRLLPMTGGPLTLDPHAWAAMLAHLGYSVVIYLAVSQQLVNVEHLAAISTVGDVLFGVAIALVTEGANSPFYVFFAFAVLAAGFRGGMRPAVLVTGASVVLYLSLIVVSRPEGVGFYVMRPAYLAITGYLVGYLGEQRLVLEARVRELEGAAQRERIARSLHDGYVQALAGVNLRLETCRELLRRERREDAFVELTELQAGVNREHDAVRAYIYSLVDRQVPSEAHDISEGTRYAVRADFDGSIQLIEHALQIMLEGARNVARHARAHAAWIAVSGDGSGIRIDIDDDGIGFPDNAAPPWSIASRAAELGGTVRLDNTGPGAHLTIELERL